jgi:hypothetical protein
VIYVLASGWFASVLVLAAIMARLVLAQAGRQEATCTALLGALASAEERWCAERNALIARIQAPRAAEAMAWAPLASAQAAIVTDIDSEWAGSAASAIPWEPDLVAGFTSEE